MPVRSLRCSSLQLALMGAASVVSLAWAGEAAAACNANPNQPLNNITTDGTVVLCTGAVSGPTITANASGVFVDVNGSGTNVNGGSITTNGNGNTVAIRNNSVVNGAVITLNGPGGTLNWGAGSVTNNLIVSVTGHTSQLIFASGSQVTQNPGQMTISAAAGDQNTIIIGAGGGLFATGSNGQYLLNGGSGNQAVTISGTMQAATDGFAIALGDGDDSITIGGTANITAQGGGAALFNGGTGNDTFSLNYNGSWIHNTVGFETININPITAVTLTGTNNDATQINVQNGTVTVNSGAPLGVVTSTVDIGAFANLHLNYAASATFNHTLTGSGGLNVNSAGNTITFGGNGNGYSGGVGVSANTTAVIGVVNALGTGNITNNGTVSFGGFNLTNNVSGTGQVIVTGSGSSRLSGTNTFSGGLDIRGGILDVDGVASLGTGTVTSSTGGGILAMGSTGNEVLSNNLTGNLALVMGGTGILDLTGTNSYTAGTLINNGAVRVDSFARLGTGQVIANSGGSLILNYNGAGQLLQATAFLTGSGSFIKEGTGDVVINVANTYTGGTTIRAGRLGLNNGDALGTGNIQVDNGAELGVGGIILNNNITGSGLVRKTASNVAEFYGDNSGFTGTMQVEDGILFATNGNAFGSGTLQIDTGAAAELNAAGNSTVAAGLSGGGVFEKYGSGLVTLTGAGTNFTGTVSITGGALQLAGSANIGNTANILIGSAGTLALDTNGNTTLFNAVSGDGNVVKTGSGTVFLTGSNSYTGGTNIQQGAIRVTNLGALGTGPVSVAAGAALDLSINGSATYNGAISGAGILRKSDIGDLNLVSNTLAGGLDIVGGRVIVTNVGAIGAGNVTTAADTQLVVNITGNQGLLNQISGAGTLTKDGTGLLAVNTANSYTGGTLINAGRLVANVSGAFGTGSINILQNAELGLGGVMLANSITGAGAVFKTANNVGMLTGVNTYSGGTFIQGGTLLVNSPAALGSGSVDISAGAALGIDYSGASNVAMNNLITGGGGLFKLGTGTVVVNNANSYTGGTQIAAGTLGLNFGTGLGAGTVTVDAGATLAIGDISLANNVNGAGRIVKTSAGASTLSGTNTHSGGTVVQAGTLNVGGLAPLGSGTVTVGNGTTLNFASAAPVTFTNALTGAGTFRNSGTGQLSFTNAFSMGSLDLVAGRTRLNAVGTTNVAVGANATLDGTGRIIGNLTNNGTVAPGNSIGTLTVQGNYVHNANSVLEIEFDAAGGIDLLAVTGTATLNGGTLRFVSLGNAEGQGGTFLTAAGGITGTFATVETVGAQLPLAVIYETGRAFMAPSVLTARPSTFNAQTLAAADTGFAFMNAVANQPVNELVGRRLWMEGFGSWNSRSASGSTLGYDHDGYGLAGGMNFRIADRISIGGAIGWSSSDIALSSNGGSGEQKTVLGSLHARYQVRDGFALTAGVLFGQVDQTTVRNVSFNGFSASVQGSTDSTLFGGFVAAQLPLYQSDRWTMGADVRGSLIRQSQDGYTESGTSPLRLTVAQIDTTTFQSDARLFAETRLMDRTNGGEETSEMLTLRFDLGARYQNLAGDRAIPVRFAASNAGVTLLGDGRDGAQGFGGVSLAYTTRGGLTARIGYEAETGRSDRHSIRAGISLPF
jgi:autotransporter-associated beta strand protein